MERASKAKAAAGRLADKAKRKQSQVLTAKSACELRRGAERSARARLAAASSRGDEEDRAEAEKASHATLLDTHWTLTRHPPSRRRRRVTPRYWTLTGHSHATRLHGGEGESRHVADSVARH